MKITSNNEDKRYMRYALNLAKRNLGNTGKNPSVGCVIVSKEKIIISAASTGLNGSPHAEKIAIEKSCADIEGATVYVTLEPCNHSGENPPCAELLVKEKISRVVISQKDDTNLTTHHDCNVKLISFQIQLNLDSQFLIGAVKLSLF